MSYDVYPMFSSSNYVASGLIFKFGFYIGGSVDSWFKHLHVEIQIPKAICCRDYPHSGRCFQLFCQEEPGCRHTVNFWAFYSVSLAHLSTFVPALDCFGYDHLVTGA